MKFIMGWQGGPAGKGTCYQASQPDFDPGNPRGGKKELTSKNCTLTSVSVCLFHTHI